MTFLSTCIIGCSGSMYYHCVNNESIIINCLPFYAMGAILQGNSTWIPGTLKRVNRRSDSSKGKVSRYTPWRHLGESRYSSYSFLTSAIDGGEWSASRSVRALPPGKGPPVPTVQEAGWAPEPVWTQRLEEISSASVGDRTPVVQSVVRH
jgi:hypothetical protein